MSLPKIYIPKATGTIAERDIRDRFADFVNLKDYGAVGDQITDDTAAWNYFITASGGVKYIPVGSYRVNGGIKSFPEGRIVGYELESDIVTHAQIDALFAANWQYTPQTDPTYL